MRKLLAALRASITSGRTVSRNTSLEWPEAEDDVNHAVRSAAGELENLGASVREISLPWWKDIGPVFYGILSHSVSAMVESDLEGYWRRRRMN